MVGVSRVVIPGSCSAVSQQGPCGHFIPEPLDNAFEVSVMLFRQSLQRRCQLDVGRQERRQCADEGYDPPLAPPAPPKSATAKCFSAACGTGVVVGVKSQIMLRSEATSHSSIPNQILPIRSPQCSPRVVASHPCPSDSCSSHTHWNRPSRLLPRQCR